MSNNSIRLTAEEVDLVAKTLTRSEFGDSRYLIEKAIRQVNDRRQDRAKEVRDALLSIPVEGYRGGVKGTAADPAAVGPFTFVDRSGSNQLRVEALRQAMALDRQDRVPAGLSIVGVASDFYAFLAQK